MIGSSSIMSRVSSKLTEVSSLSTGAWSINSVIFFREKACAKASITVTACNRTCSGLLCENFMYVIMDSVCSFKHLNDFRRIYFAYLCVLFFKLEQKISHINNRSLKFMDSIGIFSKKSTCLPFPKNRRIRYRKHRLSIGLSLGE